MSSESVISSFSEHAAPRAGYTALRDLGARAVESGRLEEALDLFDQALVAARRSGDDCLVERAFCNRSLVAIELGRGDDTVPELRQILVGNRDPENCRLAAYHIAEAYKLAKQYKKALFYARIALDRSQILDRRDWIASSHNRIGNILLAESCWQQACAEYEQALALSDETPSVWRARIYDNVGYCRILERRFREGFDLLYRSLRILRRFGAERFQVSTRLDLCFAHLEVGREREAERHGTAALELAERFGDIDSIKNALYLLGEAANVKGDRPAATAYFSRLEPYYPNAPFVTDFLVAVNVRKMINLKA